MGGGRTFALIIVALLSGIPVATLAQERPVPAPKFDIQRFEISGNTLLPQEEAERIVAPFIGKRKDFGDIQRALEALEEAYRDRGYGVVRVFLPEQDITKGVVQFRVRQPRIAKVTVEGNTRFDDDNIRRSVPAVREGETPNAQDIARNLQMLGEHPAKQTTVVLRSARTESEIDVNVKVTDQKPWRVILSLDDTGTGDTGYLRSGVAFQHSNLFDRDHTLTAQYLTSPTHPSKVSIYGVGYRAPYYRLNSSFDLIAGYSDVNSGTVQNLFNVSGSGTIFGARWNYYLPKWGEVEQKLIGGADYRAFKNEVLLAGQGLVPDITIHPVSLAYSGVLRMAAAEFNFYGGASTNIPGGNDGKDADFAASRTGATANYTIFRYGASYVQAFEGEWQARAAFNGQYTTDALVPGEQFGVGGPDSVRGYLLREVTNDRGYATQLEIYTPNLAPAAGLQDSYRARLLAFYDFGGVKRNNALPGEQEGKFIASTGVGVRIGYGKSVSLRMDVAQILKAAGTRQTDDQRVSASLAIVF
ncbi:MAG: ShlB/FhaC/HecB family hemolysin secretion/activation protein [Betaproteobacteria bacterium]|nr:ShlB/FhaC/HecB family hemolysin secretion/activation protein [Betaproteobacteria bacterium]